MKNNMTQLSIALALVLCLGLLIDPFMLWMPDMMEMTLLLCTTVLLCIWIGFVMREKARDERELMHRMHAGRIAYLSGVGVLTLALVVQGLAHTLDPWIAVALSVMVLAKLGAHFYADTHL